MNQAKVYHDKIKFVSGHSKWATIHRQKEVKDAKRGAAFTKLAAAITMAVREGGGVADANQNFKLRLTIERARQFNMPKENISRAVEKGSGARGENDLETVMFEGFLPGGAVVMAEALTDNKLMTAQSVRMLLDKGGGNLGGSGSVGYMFSQQGEVRIASGGLGEEDELKMIDLGAEDIVKEDGEWVIYCQKEKTFEVKANLERGGYRVVGAELTMRPTVMVEVGDKSVQERIEKILGALEDLEDVQKVWTNYA